MSWQLKLLMEANKQIMLFEIIIWARPKSANFQVYLIKHTSDALAKQEQRWCNCISTDTTLVTTTVYVSLSKSSDIIPPIVTKKIV